MRLRAWLAVVCGLGLFSLGCDDRRGTIDEGTDSGPKEEPLDARIDAPSDAPIDAPPPDAGHDAGPPPVFRHAVDTDDYYLGMDALTILGDPDYGGTTYCNECHALTRPTLLHWYDLTANALEGCLSDVDVQSADEASRILSCLHDGTESTIRPRSLGIASTATTLDWFRYVFEIGAGADWETQHAEFVHSAGMPLGRTPMTQDQFDTVMEWFVRGLPYLTDLVTDSPPPGSCVPYVAPEVAAHVTDMTTSGWGAINREAGILMYGCAGASTPVECMSTLPLATDMDFGTTWNPLPGASLRLLYTTDYQSSYWTRSSADGRFVAHGGGVSSGSSFIDLQDQRHIDANASYDPAFFPDNSGFVFQGTFVGTAVCEQGVLALGAPTRINFTEPQCTGSIGIGLYEHLGASLHGGDYWAVSGLFESDDGGHWLTQQDPAAGFPSDTATTFTRMINSGAGFVFADQIDVPTPYEGDAVFSPSTQLIATRLPGEDWASIGYALHKMVVTTTSSGGLDIALPEIGRYCFPGGKPNFSFDERYMVLHHYIGDSDAVDLGFTDAGDPGFAEYRAQGAANIYLVDLTTGVRTRITNMAPGQYALFPHFRSDGWLYFIVRTADQASERIVASDAALILSSS